MVWVNMEHLATCPDANICEDLHQRERRSIVDSTTISLSGQVRSHFSLPIISVLPRLHSKIKIHRIYDKIKGYRYWLKTEQSSVQSINVRHTSLHKSNLGKDYTAWKCSPSKALDMSWKLIDKSLRYGYWIHDDWTEWSFRSGWKLKSMYQELLTGCFTYLGGLLR